VATAKTCLTAEDLLALPDDGLRHELLDGELVDVAPPGGEHGSVQMNIGVVLIAHVKPRGLGVVLGEVGVILRRDPDRVRAPDVCFIARDRLPQGRVPKGYLELVPDLVVEVVSPSDRAEEVQQKIEEWLRAGARLVWVVYPATRSVAAYRGGAEAHLYAEPGTLDGAPVLPDFACPVAELFEPAR
jgi:Uma2 family endonuclease